MILKERECLSFNDYYMSITLDQFVCTNELTLILTMSGGTYFNDDDSTDSDPITTYIRDKSRSEETF